MACSSMAAQNLLSVLVGQCGVQIRVGKKEEKGKRMDAIIEEYVEYETSCAA
jgi:proteasome assembly chaperone (PAC2) family protein